MDGLGDAVLSFANIVASCELADFPIDLPTRQEGGCYEVLVRDDPAS
jgi:hypothetical protein